MEYDTSLHLTEIRQRAERMQREATLLASLPAAEQPHRPRPFARRVRPLAEVVEIRRPAAALAPDTREAA
jgi:hypothetical protein